MTGPYDGVIGVKKELVVNKFLNGMPSASSPPRAMSGSAPWSLIATRIRARPVALSG